jgi:hypothetical protein
MLSFPSNPTQGQTYQSGSSSTYLWNGDYWETSLPPTQTVLNAENAAFAVTASYLATPTICMQGVPDQNINNNTVVYATSTIIDLTNLSTKFSIGSFTVGATGITPNESGFYKIEYSGWVLDNGANPTVGYFTMGVNGVEVSRTQASLSVNYGIPINFQTIHQVTAGQLVDFRMGTSGNESIRVRHTTITVTRVG